MKENKTNILIFFGISIFCILLTYAVSAFNLGWNHLPKDFLLSIFSGISASSFVVLFTELIKYNLNKKNIENALYGNLRELYRLLLSQIKYTEMLFENPQKAVADNIYSASVPAMNNFVTALKFLQYEPFVKNSFAKAFYDFKQDEIENLEKYMSACMNFLQISILKTTIEKMKLGNSNYSPVSSDEKVLETLEIMKNKAEKRCKIVNELIFSLDNNCKHRFSWEKDKAIVDDYSFSPNDVSIQKFFENNTYSAKEK